METLFKTFFSLKEWRELGAPPMQKQHSKELLEEYMTPPDKGQKERGQKRRGSFMNEKEVKKRKSERKEVDMDTESDETGRLKLCYMEREML